MPDRKVERMTIVVKQNSHLAEVVKKIVKHGVDEKTSLFAERYCSNPRTLENRPCLESSKAMLLNADWQMLRTKTGRMSCQKDVELVEEKPCSGS